jgi:hypothetical protein
MVNDLGVNRSKAEVAMADGESLQRVQIIFSVRG